MSAKKTGKKGKISLISFTVKSPSLRDYPTELPTRLAHALQAINVVAKTHGLFQEFGVIVGRGVCLFRHDPA